MFQHWYYLTDDFEEIGPISSATLRALADTAQIHPETLLRRNDGAIWTTAKMVRGLFDLDVHSPEKTKAERDTLSPTPPQLPLNTSPTGKTLRTRSFGYTVAWTIIGSVALASILIIAFVNSNRAKDNGDKLNAGVGDNEKLKKGDQVRNAGAKNAPSIIIDEKTQKQFEQARLARNAADREMKDQLEQIRLERKKIEALSKMIREDIAAQENQRIERERQLRQAIIAAEAAEHNRLQELTRRNKERVDLSKESLKAYKMSYLDDPELRDDIAFAWNVLRLLTSLHLTKQLDSEHLRKLGNNMVIRYEDEQLIVLTLQFQWPNQLVAMAPNYRFNHDPEMPTLAEIWIETGKVWTTLK